MTDKEFAFWEMAFLAAMQGELAGQNETTGTYAPTMPDYLTSNASSYADAALAVWREKRGELEREHVEKVVTNESGN